MAQKPIKNKREGKTARRLFRRVSDLLYFPSVPPCKRRFTARGARSEDLLPRDERAQRNHTRSSDYPGRDADLRHVSACALQETLAIKRRVIPPDRQVGVSFDFSFIYLTLVASPPRRWRSDLFFSRIERTRSKRSGLIRSSFSVTSLCTVLLLIEKA